MDVLSKGLNPKSCDIVFNCKRPSSEFACPMYLSSGMIDRAYLDLKSKENSSPEARKHTTKTILLHTFGPKP